MKTNKAVTKNFALKQTQFKAVFHHILTSFFFFFFFTLSCSKIRKIRPWHVCLKGMCSEGANPVTNFDFYASRCTLKWLFPPAGFPICVLLFSKIPSRAGTGGGERKQDQVVQLGRGYRVRFGNRSVFEHIKSLH